MAAVVFCNICGEGVRNSLEDMTDHLEIHGPMMDITSPEDVVDYFYAEGYSFTIGRGSEVHAPA